MSEVPLYASHLSQIPGENVTNHCCLLRKVDVRLPGKGDSNSYGARPVHLFASMIKWIRTSRVSIESSLSAFFWRIS